MRGVIQTEQDELRELLWKEHDALVIAQLCLAFSMLMNVALAIALALVL